MYLVDNDKKITYGPFNGDYSIHIESDSDKVYFEVWHIPSENCILTVLAEYAIMEGDIGDYEGYTQSHLGPEANLSS